MSSQDSTDARDLLAVADSLVRKSVWLVGGDGWAYDIGAGGLDHVLGSGAKVNVLVLDTEVYSNTGGQMSKATPRAAVAKFATGGKQTAKKDLALEAISYGSVYVARVAMGGNDTHTVKAFLEAEAYDGPSLIIAYSHCIAHGYDLAFGMEQQKAAVLSGYWPLMRYNPALRAEGKNPFQLDSRAPSIPLKKYIYQEARYSMLARNNPREADRLLELAQGDVDRRWKVYSNHALGNETPVVSQPETVASTQHAHQERRRDMIDITTTYMGLPLRSPIVASASPLCDSLENIRRFEESGVGAVVLPSLFEEQLELESNAVHTDLSRGAESFPESLNYFPNLQSYNLGPDAYLELIRKARAAVSIPVIASLNGTSVGGWTHHAKLIEQAGASALELNIYDVVSDAHHRGSRIEEDYCELVRQVKACVRIPVAVKISPFFTAMANMAKQLDDAGADGLVLFNRFYQPDIDIDALEIVPSLTLSQSQELPLRLHWVAILHGLVGANLAVTGGVHSGRDVLKAMMAGAHVAMMTSAFFQSGIRHANVVLHEMSQWMEEHEYESIQQMRGSMSRRSVPNPSAFDRANYIRVLSSYTLNPRRTAAEAAPGSTRTE